MAISVDTVYQRVLAILNKEQRGYLTPVEFNLLANQAQMSIFEQYFNDVSQFSRIPGNDREFSDPLENLQEKINFFQKEGITVIDADYLAREVIEQDTPGFKRIVDYFGSDVISDDGSIDRGKLRKIVF